MAASSNYEATFTQAAIPGASASRHIRVPAFARFEAMLNRLEKASALTPAPPSCSMREHKPINAATMVVVGCVRNGARTVRRALETLARATADFASVQFLVVESDSTDATVATLTRLREQSERFQFISLGALAERISARTERIAHCRNRYLEELRNNSRYASVDYVLVADLDGVNDDLRREAVATCWSTDNPWDVVTANQRDAYYDIWALRHPDWCPVDCQQQYARLRAMFEKPRALAIAIHSRMVRLSPRAAWIEVDSAFGGLAIYRREVLLAGSYSGMQDGQSICEHVPLHAQLRAQGLRIFINPALINAHRTDHSARIRLHVRLRREIEAFGKRLRDRWRS
jgi:glycosyltransferase involved in cell wall biosynthesis